MKELFFEDCDNIIGENSSHPTKPETQSHYADVLRQVQRAAFKEGSWVGGNSWFCSVISCVEMVNFFKVHSTFIAKIIKFFSQW